MKEAQAHSGERFRTHNNKPFNEFSEREIVILELRLRITHNARENEINSTLFARLINRKGEHGICSTFAC